MSYILVYTTTPSIELANEISRSLLEKNLAACINQRKIFSTYRWKNKVISEEEFELKIKTKLDKFNTIKEIITSLHSYEVPEIIAVPIIDGSSEYLKFINEEVV